MRGELWSRHCDRPADVLIRLVRWVLAAGCDGSASSKVSLVGDIMPPLLQKYEAIVKV